MILTTLNKRIRYRIVRSKQTVFLPTDFMDLSDRDQVGRVLRQLINSGDIIKIGYGLYAKAKTSSISGKIVPQKSLPELGKEALLKLGVEVFPSKYELAYNEGRSTQVPTGRVIGIKNRISRKIGYDGKYIVFEKLS